MKTLGKLEINPERLMRNDELMTLRGGYGILFCYKNGVECYTHQLTDCIWAHDICAIFCPGYDKKDCTDY